MLYHLLISCKADLPTKKNKKVTDVIQLQGLIDATWSSQFKEVCDPKTDCFRIATVTIFVGMFPTEFSGSKPA